MQRIFIAAVFFISLSLGAPAQAPQPAPPTVESAESLASKGRLDKALAMLDQLAAQSPEPAGVERLRGIIFYQREQLQDAIQAFSKAANQDPDDRESIEMQGVSLYRTGSSYFSLEFLVW
jgi:Flp pilus assembly protein TadD